MRVVAGDISYRIVAIERDGQWFARAEREDTGVPFGIESAGPSKAAASAALRTWLEWQSEHAAALLALQSAERTFHRTIAGHAFASGGEASTSGESQKESLLAVEEARATLDAIRARRP